MRTKTALLPWALLASLLVGGCLDVTPREGADVPGDLLGNYQVHATLKNSTCPASMFDAPATWDFVVRLSRDGHQLYWSNGAESIRGKIEDDDVSFSFSTEIAVPVDQKAHSKQTCTLWRQDRASGVMAGSKEDMTGFRGSLTYEFDEAEGSHCVTSEPELAFVNELPCKIAYDLNAVRKED